MIEKHAEGTLYVISAPSGAGKTSLIKALLPKVDDLDLSVSHTTRQKRATEENSVDYFFVSIDEFNQMVAEEKFVEHACVFDNFYGTSSEHIQEVLDSGKDLILEIDWQGGEQVTKKFPDCLTIFILPPSKSELASRLNHRGLDSEEVINNRMQQAEKEMSHYHNYDYIIVNDDFDIALEQLQSVIISNRLVNKKQEKNLVKLVENLLPA